MESFGRNLELLAPSETPPMWGSQALRRDRSHLRRHWFFYSAPELTTRSSSPLFHLLHHHHYTTPYQPTSISTSLIFQHNATLLGLHSSWDNPMSTVYRQDESFVDGDTQIPSFCNPHNATTGNGDNCNSSPLDLLLLSTMNSWLSEDSPPITMDTMKRMVDCLAMLGDLISPPVPTFPNTNNNYPTTTENMNNIQQPFRYPTQGDFCTYNPTPTYTQQNIFPILITLIYANKFLSKLSKKITSKYVMRILVIANLAYAKFWDDKFMNNFDSHYNMLLICQLTGWQKHELLAMERYFLQILDYSLFLTETEIQEFVYSRQYGWSATFLLSTCNNSNHDLTHKLRDVKTIHCPPCLSFPFRELCFLVRKSSERKSNSFVVKNASLRNSSVVKNDFPPLLCGRLLSSHYPSIL